MKMGDEQAPYYFLALRAGVWCACFIPLSYLCTATCFVTRFVTLLFSCYLLASTRFRVFCESFLLDRKMIEFRLSNFFDWSKRAIVFLGTIRLNAVTKNQLSSQADETTSIFIHAHPSPGLLVFTRHPYPQISPPLLALPLQAFLYCVCLWKGMVNSFVWLPYWPPNVPQRLHWLSLHPRGIRASSSWAMFLLYICEHSMWLVCCTYPLSASTVFWTRSMKIGSVGSPRGDTWTATRAVCVEGKPKVVAYILLIERLRPSIYWSFLFPSTGPYRCPMLPWEKKRKLSFKAWYCLYPLKQVCWKRPGEGSTWRWEDNHCVDQRRD